MYVWGQGVFSGQGIGIHLTPFQVSLLICDFNFLY